MFRSYIVVLARWSGSVPWLRERGETTVFDVRLQLGFLRERGNNHDQPHFAGSVTSHCRLRAVSVPAGTIELSDVRITARATFSSQRVPETSDFDIKIAPPDQLLQAAQALVIEGLPFPNQPNSQNAGFASSAGSSAAFLASV